MYLFLVDFSLLTNYEEKRQDKRKTPISTVNIFCNVSEVKHTFIIWLKIKMHL